MLSKMAQCNVDNKVHQSSRLDVRVIVKNNDAYMFSEEKILTKFSHSKKYILKDAVIFKDVLYTKCTFQIQLSRSTIGYSHHIFANNHSNPFRSVTNSDDDFDFVKEKTMIFMWKENKCYYFFAGDDTHIFKINDQLYIANKEQHISDSFLDCERFVFYSVNDGVIEKKQDIVGNYLGITTTNETTYILQDGVVFKVDKNLSFSKISDFYATEKIQ